MLTKDKAELFDLTVFQTTRPFDPFDCPKGVALICALTCFVVEWCGPLK